MSIEVEMCPPWIQLALLTRMYVVEDNGLSASPSSMNCCSNIVGNSAVGFADLKKLICGVIELNRSILSPT
jgi:hypothetical protein